MYERQKNYDAAEEQFKKVLNRDPNNASLTGQPSARR